LPHIVHITVTDTAIGTASTVTYSQDEYMGTELFTFTFTKPGMLIFTFTFNI